MAEPIIRMRNIYKRFYIGQPNELEILHGIDLDVMPGEFLSIVGPSGSGKSTLMNILGCLDTPTKGEYLLDGHAVSGLNDQTLSLVRNRHIGFIFQGFNLVSNLNALENVELPLQYRGMTRIQRRELATACLDQVGLGRRLHHRPAEMSGGQQQRVAIARALAAQPPIILADEPTGNLDQASGSEVMAILNTLHQNGTTIILITHDNAIADQAPRRVCICEGRIVSDQN